MNIYDEGARVRRAVGEAPTHTSRVSHTTDQLRIPFSEHAWETEAGGNVAKKRINNNICIGVFSMIKQEMFLNNSKFCIY